MFYRYVFCTDIFLMKTTTPFSRSSLLTTAMALALCAAGCRSVAAQDHRDGGSETAADSDSDTGTDSDTGADSDTDADTDSDTATETDTGSDTAPDCSWFDDWDSDTNECCSDSSDWPAFWWQDAETDGVTCAGDADCPSGACDEEAGLCACTGDDDCRDGLCTVTGLCGPSWCNGYCACSCWGGCDDSGLPCGSADWGCDEKLYGACPGYSGGPGACDPD
jgi:hypothetical protein